MTKDQDNRTGAADTPTWKDALLELSEEDLTAVVTRICSTYGTVMKVAIYTTQSHRNVIPFALVDMLTISDAARLAAAFNRPCLGTAVVFPLERRPAG